MSAPDWIPPFRPTQFWKDGAEWWCVKDAQGLTFGPHYLMPAEARVLAQQANDLVRYPKQWRK